MKKSFLPVISADTRALFLGTLPGEKSLTAQQYYAHPQNKFWPLFFDVWKEHYRDNYSERLFFLQQKGFGLWDVLHKANRKGSLDTAITDYVVNDFKALLEEYSNVQVFYFTSQQAYKWFFKTYKDTLPVRLVVLSSPSPANARMSYAEKLKDWNEKILDYSL